MPAASPQTIGETLYWSYANLAMAHAAVSRGDVKYGRLHFMIRAKLYSGLRTGQMDLGSIVEDERLKMVLPQCCTYCGAVTALAVDHLIARVQGGMDSGDNIVWACRSCNSSKRATDVLIWLASRNEFPPLFLLRRYLKLAIDWTNNNSCMNVDLLQAQSIALPFALSAVPTTFPVPIQLRLWIEPQPH